MNTVNHTQTFSLDELCALTDLTKRTVRYYVQIGLVNRPEGETRAAKYSPQHLEQLLLVKKWTVAGVSLDRIRELLLGQTAPLVSYRPCCCGASAANGVAWASARNGAGKASSVLPSTDMPSATHTAW